MTEILISSDVCPCVTSFCSVIYFKHFMHLSSFELKGIGIRAATVNHGMYFGILIAFGGKLWV